jgi:hypothetical protein
VGEALDPRCCSSELRRDVICCGLQWREAQADLLVDDGPVVFPAPGTGGVRELLCVAAIPAGLVQQMFQLAPLNDHGSDEGQELLMPRGCS